MVNIPPPNSDYVPGNSIMPKNQLNEMRLEVQKAMLSMARAFHDYQLNPEQFPTRYTKMFDALSAADEINTMRGDFAYRTLADIFSRVPAEEIDAMLEQSSTHLECDVRLYHDVKQNMTIVIPTRHTPMGAPALSGTPSHDEFHDALLALYDSAIIQQTEKFSVEAESHGRQGKSPKGAALLTESQWYAFDDNEDLVNYVNAITPMGIRFSATGENRYLN